MGKLNVLPKKYDFLDASDNKCTFRINIDVLNEAFGAEIGMFMKGAYPAAKNDYISCSNTGEECFVWLPKLYGNKSEWKNSISDDDTEIFEVAETTRHEDWTSYQPELIPRLRIAFVKPSPNEPYRFVGVFRNKEMNHLKHIYERIATKIKLIGNPVHSIELIDDLR